MKSENADNPNPLPRWSDSGGCWETESPRLCLVFVCAQLIAFVLSCGVAAYLHGEYLSSVMEVAFFCTFAFVFALPWELQAIFTHAIVAKGRIFARDANPRSFKRFVIVNGVFLALTGLTAIGCWTYEILDYIGAI